MTVNGTAYQIAVDGQSATVNGKTYQVSAGPADSQAAAPRASDDATPVMAQMPGVVLKILANPGDSVSHGQAILVLEAMKMEVDVASPSDGTVASIEVAVGDHVANGQKLASIA